MSAPPPVLPGDDASLTRAVDEALLSQCRVTELHAQLADGPDAEKEALLTPLLLSRDHALAVVGRLVIEAALSGRRIRLVDESATSPASIAETALAASPADAQPMETPPTGATEPFVIDTWTIAPPEPAAIVSAPAAQPPVFDPPDPAALTALTGKLGPSWTREASAQPIYTPPSPELIALLATLGDAAPLVTEEDLQHEARHLDYVTSAIGTWRKFPAPAQVLLIEVITGRVRAAQGSSVKSVGTTATTLDGCINRMHQYAKTARPGMAYGLARSHMASKVGWRVWANDQLRQLQATYGEGVPDSAPAQPKALSKPVKPPNGDQPDPEPQLPVDARELIPADWPFWPLTRGGDAVILGGDIREERRAVVEEAFEFASLEWIPGKMPRRTAALVESIARGGVQLVILLRGFISHRDSDLVASACNKAGVRFVLVINGYGVAQIRAAIEQRFTVRKAAG